MAKDRNTINVSLQSRKYREPMNKLIHSWEEDGNNLSVQICENLLLLEKLQKSATMLKVINMFELTKKTLELYNIKDDAKIEEIMSKIVLLDASGLNEIFLTMNQIQDTQKNTENIETKKITVNEMIEKKLEPNNQDNSFEQINKTEPKIEVPIPTLDSLDIPMDFLING